VRDFGAGMGAGRWCGSWLNACCHTAAIRVCGLVGEVAWGVGDGGGLVAEVAGRWVAVRGVLTANRHALTRVAGELYPGVLRVTPAELLCREEWLPGAPLGLDEPPLTWDGPAATEPAASPAGRYGAGSEHVRPLRAAGAAVPSRAWKHRALLLGWARRGSAGRAPPVPARPPPASTGCRQELPEPGLTTSTVISRTGLAQAWVLYLMNAGVVWFGG